MHSVFRQLVRQECSSQTFLVRVKYHSSPVCGVNTLIGVCIDFFRELFRISLSNYQEWFKAAVTFWLQTFREECMRRMMKALEIEKDVCLYTL